MTAPGSAPGSAAVRLGRPVPEEADSIAALNNRFAPDGLTLPRTAAWVEQHLADYRVARDADGTIVGCVCVDEYTPALAELVSLAVHPDAQGRGLGKQLIQAAITLARQRGYATLFAVSFSDELFLSQGFRATSVDHFPEKVARYAAISRSEVKLGRKFCFAVEVGPASRTGTVAASVRAG